MRKLASTPRANESPDHRANSGPQGQGASAAREAAELLFDLLMAQKKITQGVAKEFGFSLQQLAALRNLVPGEGMPMSALAEALSCDAANITAVVDKLEARGLVKRSASPDRRVRLIETTEQGAILRATFTARLSEPAPWITVLNRQDQRLLRDLLRKGLAGIRPESGSNASH
jgi:DNA-binding MarR family transcriptional regulator